MPSESTPITIWFNPRCSKARRARQLLEERGVEFQVIDYRQTPPTRAQLDDLLTKLGATDSPRSIVRQKEALYSELGLSEADHDTLLNALCEHPTLLERPIVVHGDRAVVARPPETLETLF